MHSGGGCKEKPYEIILIEAAEEGAKIIFYNKFGHDPERVTCTCCGDDYSINESETLEEATAYDRNCEWDKEGKRYIEKPRKSDYMKYDLIKLKDYISKEDVLVVYAKDIKEDWKTGDVPDEGYVWV